MTTNKVVRRIDFPEEVVTRDTLFTNLIIDETTSRPENYCDDVFVYITDTVSPGKTLFRFIICMLIFVRNKLDVHLSIHMYLPTYTVSIQCYQHLCNNPLHVHVFSGLVVYDSGRDLTWRLSHPSMYPDPNFAESTILEHKFTLMDGVVGLSFDPESATVYFQPLATDRYSQYN